MINKFVRFIFKNLHSIRKWYWRTFEIKTFGTRVLLEKEGKVFLVQHRYNPLWVLPGGGMKRDEIIEEVAKREVHEEIGIKINSFSKRLGTYKNTQEGKNDTVTILIAKEWEEGGELSFWAKIMKKIEIKDEGWFHLSKLPDGTSNATRRRVNEYLEGLENVEGKW